MLHTLVVGFVRSRLTGDPVKRRVGPPESCISRSRPR